MQDFGRILIGIGVLLIIVGGVFLLMNKFNIGRLPGDIFIERGNFKFFFPITTSIIISIVLTIILRLLRK